MRRITQSACTCACQVDKLRTTLENARRRLGAQSRGMQQQWRRGVTLGDTTRLLGDINQVVDSPQRVQRLEDAKARACALSTDEQSSKIFCQPHPGLARTVQHLSLRKS